MRILANVFFASSLSLLLLSCNSSEVKSGSSSSANSKWTDYDKENALRACKTGYKGYDEAKVAKVCDCYLEKVMTLSPDPMKQSEISLPKATEISVECRKEAGLEM
jgi:hypothetical protein